MTVIDGDSVSVPASHMYISYFIIIFYFDTNFGKPNGSREYDLFSLVAGDNEHNPLCVFFPSAKFK